MYITVKNKQLENIRVSTTDKSPITGENETVEYNFHNITSPHLDRVIADITPDDYLHVIDLYNMILDPDNIIVAHPQSQITPTDDILHLRSKGDELIQHGKDQEEYYQSEMAKQNKDTTYIIKDYIVDLS